MPAAAVDGEPAPVVEPLVTPEIQAACEPFVVVGHDVDIDINFRERSISGTSTLLIFPLADDLEEISIDARQCEIDTENIYVDGSKTKARYRDPYDLLHLSPQWQLGPAQHQVVKKRLKPLFPERRPDVPIFQREKLMEHSLGCVPHEGSLKVSLRPGDLSNDGPRQASRMTAKNKEPEDERNGIKISIPFRCNHIRDGLHFVGIDEGDVRYPHVYTRHSVEPGTASCIFPCIDDPGQRHLFKISIKCPRTLGDALEQPLATQQATAGTGANGNRKRKLGETSPQKSQHVLLEQDKLLEMTVVCSGNLTGEQTDPDDDRKKIMSFECHNAAARHIGFAVGPFEHVPLWAEFRTEESDEKLGANAAKIHGYCLPGRAREVRNTCAPIVAAADYFTLEFGRYPFDSYKMCFLEDLIADTVEATSMSMCSTRLLYPYEIIDTEIEVTRKLVHSLATQYLGIHIIPNKRSDTWLVVGIQWYMTDLFMKTLCGNNWYRFHTKASSDRLVEADVGRPPLHELGEYLHVGDFESEFLALKAPLVLYILDQRMSKYPGSIGIARVISQMISAANISNTEAKTTSASAEEFFRSCEKKSQYRPESFWEQWIYGAGCPRLQIAQRFNKKNLNVEIIITQMQANPSFQQQRLLEKDDFWREFQEEIHHVYAGEVSKVFTGPFTVRIHEADGTPYEHYLEVGPHDRTGTTWSIPYNTKYKRLKRKGRQQKEATATANPNGKNDVPDDDFVFLHMLGDVLHTEEDMRNWGFQDWGSDIEEAMDQESYEWIWFDCNFEWCSENTTDMPGYMYQAQLQQDRDVVAHQDAMLFWNRGQRHPVGSSIETRTLYDRRYYHGIRSMAAQDLPKQAVSEQNYIGMAHLILSFRHFWCYKVMGSSGKETWPPTPNDFTDKAQYFVQITMPESIARIRADKGRCPKTARNFLLDLLLFNDNSENEYSDHFYISKLLHALATSLIVEEHEGDRELIHTLKPYEDDDVEFKLFIEKTTEEIDRYRRMDEWTNSYQNIWTTTALDCKMRLMKARVIPTAPLDFLQYLQDDNLDLVRIKAFECLVELGMISKPTIVKLLLCVMSTDSSPFVRDRMFKVFCRGIASIAFAENHVVAEKPAVSTEQELEDGGLIIEQGEAITAARKAKLARREDITEALAALKRDLKGNTELQIGIWRAFQSTTLGLDERRQILELCQAAFEPEDALLLTFQYPKIWKVTRAPKTNGTGEKSAKKRCLVQFTSHYRTESRNPPLPVEAPAAPTAEVRAPEPKKIKLQSKPSFSGPSGGPSAPANTGTVLPPLVSRPSISVTVPEPAADSIAVQSAARPSIAAAAPPPAQPPKPKAAPPPNSAKLAEKQPKTPSKRKSEDGESNGRPKKIAKTDVPATNGGRRKVVTVKFNAWAKLRASTRASIEAAKKAKAETASTIVAAPSRKQSSAAPRHRTRTPSRPISGSPDPGAVAAAEARNSKPRKPLPSAAPQQAPAPAQSAPAAPPPAPAPSTAASAERVPAPGKKKTIIKIKRPSMGGGSG